MEKSKSGWRVQRRTPNHVGHTLLFYSKVYLNKAFSSHLITTVRDYYVFLQQQCGKYSDTSFIPSEHQEEEIKDFKVINYITWKIYRNATLQKEIVEWENIIQK